MGFAVSLAAAQCCLTLPLHCFTSRMLGTGCPQMTRGYQAVLMDFGSARPMPIHISSRAQALAVQEDAEVRRCGGGVCLVAGGPTGFTLLGATLSDCQPGVDCPFVLLGVTGCRWPSTVCTRKLDTLEVTNLLMVLWQLKNVTSQATALVIAITRSPLVWCRQQLNTIADSMPDGDCVPACIPPACVGLR